MLRARQTSRETSSTRLGWLALTLLCLLGQLKPAIAVDGSKAISQYVHKTWRTDDGLPQSSVLRILETHDGYLWVGTAAGLARFDGVRFTVFDHANTPSLGADFVTDLVEDRQGTLWVGTYTGGVSYFRNGLFSEFGAINSRGGSALAADPDGSVWVGGYGGLAHIKNGKVIEVYTTANGLSGDPVRRIVVDKDKSLWIATAGGLDRLSGGRIQNYSTKDGLTNNDVTNLHLDVDGTLWVQMNNSPLARRVDGRFEAWNIPGVFGADIRAVLKDRSGNRWVGSSTEGLLRVNGTQVSRFTTNDGLSSDDVNCLYEDRAGNLWVGTWQGGLDRFRDGSFTTYANEEGLAAGPAYAVIEDSIGDLWVTTAGGLNLIRRNRVRVFKAPNELPTKGTWSLGVDHEQNVWVSTSDRELIRMRQARRAQTLSAPDGIPAYLITAILEDRKSQLWLATRGGGLVRFAGGSYSSYARSDGLSTNHLFALAEGEKGTIWIGTDNGLNSIENGRIKNHGSKSGLTNAWVRALYFDTDGILWIGTVGKGLFRLEGGHLTQYNSNQGLPGNTVNSILEDADSNLWLGLDRGIVRISRRDLDAVRSGIGKQVDAVHFSKADGMKSSETTGGTHPTGWRSRDGRLWFTTTRGVVVVNPARLSLKAGHSAARVEEFIADRLNVDLLAPVQLTPGTQRIQIRYTAPNLSDPERTHFRYRLEGFDHQWVAGGAPRLAQYTNLSPGRYTFRVNVRAESGQWDAQDAAITFDVLPRFFETMWFQLLYILAAMMLVWGAYRLRVSWLHARTSVLEERQRIASEIHDSLAQGLSGIIFQTEAALISMARAPDMTSSHMKLARDLAKSSLDDARYSVWNLSPPVLDQKELAESLPTMARQIARGRVEELDIHSSGAEWNLRPEATHHIVLIAQEAISNAIQHGHATTISIDLTYTDDAVTVVVSDDGVGFTPSSLVTKSNRGYGMRNMHLRAQRLGAKLEVASELGTGSKISLRVPRVGRFTRMLRYLLGMGTTRID